MTQKQADKLKNGAVVRVGDQTFKRFWFIGRFAGRYVDANENKTFYKVIFPSMMISEKKLSFTAHVYTREFLH